MSARRHARSHSYWQDRLRQLQTAEVRARMNHPHTLPAVHRAQALAKRRLRATDYLSLNGGGGAN